MHNPSVETTHSRRESRTSSTAKSEIPEILKKYELNLVDDWTWEQLSALTRRSDLIKDSQIKEESSIFIKLMLNAAQTGSIFDITTPAWDNVREFLGNL